jgi:nucleotide-binding universal stress UspA family protein
MFKTILIPTDGSDLSRKALLYGVQLARENKARVVALTVRPPYVIGSMDMIGVVGSQDEFEAETQRYADYALTQAKMAGEAAGVPVETVQDVGDQPYRAIIDCAKAHDCDLIVMASHGRRGVSALLLGSETAKVLTHSHVPVLVYR